MDEEHREECLETIVSEFEKEGGDPMKAIAAGVQQGSWFEGARRLFETGYRLSKEHVSSCSIHKDDALGYLIGLHVMHGEDPTELFLRVSDENNSLILIARGFYFFKEKEYREALRFFTRARYVRGQGLVYLAQRNRAKALEIDDPLVRGLCDSRKWGRSCSGCVDPDVFKHCDPDVQFRVGISERYAHENSLDVLLSRVEVSKEYIEKLKNAREDEVYTAEIDYVIGKVYHEMGNLGTARKFYHRAITGDREYLPAAFNYSRLCRCEVQRSRGYGVIEDYNAMVLWSKGKESPNVEKCSERIRRWIRMNETVDGMRDELERGELNSEFEAGKVLNNLGVIRKNKELLIQGIAEENEECSIRYMKYNLGILSRDAGMLRELEMDEADAYADFYEYVNTGQKMRNTVRQAYMKLVAQKDIEECQHVLENSENELFRDCCLAYSYYLLDSEDAIPKVVELCQNNSFYCLNILGVLYGKYGHYEEALCIFNQLEADLRTGKFDEFRDSLYSNISNVYYLMEEYQTCFLYLKKLNHVDKAIGMGVVEHLGDGEVLRQLIPKFNIDDELKTWIQEKEAVFSKV